MVRPGYTFRLAPGWPGKLANTKAKLIVVSRDSYDAGEPSEADDLVTQELRKALSLMGINDIGVLRAGGSLAVNLGKVRIEDHQERGMRLRLRRWQEAPERLAASEHESQLAHSSLSGQCAH